MSDGALIEDSVIGVFPYQRCYITGYLKYGKACKIPDDADMKIKIIQGDDLTIQLAVIGEGNQEIDYDIVTGAKFELKDGSGGVIISLDETDGIFIDKKILAVLEESDTEDLAGTYTYEFTLYIGDSTNTVIANSTLAPASFEVRAK